jgi:hypothetical protein
MRKRLICCLSFVAVCGVGFSYYSSVHSPLPIEAQPASIVSSAPSRLSAVWNLGRIALKAARTAASSSAPSTPPQPAYDPELEERKIADSGALRNLVEKAGLEADEARSIAHILEVHGRSQSSLEAALAGDEQLATLKEQILSDTVAQLRTRIPDSAWDDFAHSGLLALPAVADHAAATTNN